MEAGGVKTIMERVWFAGFTICIVLGALAATLALVVAGVDPYALDWGSRLAWDYGPVLGIGVGTLANHWFYAKWMKRRRSLS